MTERKDALPCRMQDLPPAGARLCMAVGRFLKETCGVSPHHVIVAFSGGADSTALAVILRGLPPFLLLLCAAVMLVGTAIAVVSAVLSHLIQKAADLKADQDLTI